MRNEVAFSSIYECLMRRKWGVLDLLLADVTKYVISPFPTRYYCLTAGGGMHSGTLSIVEPESGVTMLNSTIDNCEQYGQHNIQACFQQYSNK